ncbi:MAG: hypothetical protein QME75_05415 [Deltaproteobacteria bacterium]|nr:hypothetical protein [Deltaproteobacteria bacterium]
MFRNLERSDVSLQIRQCKQIISSHSAIGGAMQKPVKDYFQGLEIGPRADHQNMSVFPFFFMAEAGLQYLPLDAALASGVIEVAEVSEGGDVPNLKVTNKGEIPILILAGEELVGAKQNRIVNATFLIAGKARFNIPVSCVEQGRWSYQSKHFMSERRMSSPQLRSRVELDLACSIREGRGFRANQSGVWDEIGTKSARMSVHSPTGAMSDIYESYEDQLRQYTESFSLSPNQKGFLVAINGRMAGMEAFGSQDSLANYFTKLIQSYALDAIDLHRQGQSSKHPEDGIEAWVEEIRELPVISSPSLSLGEDLRVESEKVIGSGLMHEGTVLYLSVFSKNGSKNKSGMARASRRGSFNRDF